MSHVKPNNSVWAPPRDDGNDSGSHLPSVTELGQCMQEFFSESYLAEILDMMKRNV